MNRNVWRYEPKPLAQIEPNYPPLGQLMEFLDVMAHPWRFEETGQRLEFPSFIRSHNSGLKAVSEIKISHFLVDY